MEVIFGCIKEMEECRDRLSRHALILTNIRRCCQDKNRVNSRGNILSCFFLWKLYLGKPRPVYDWTIGNPDGNYLNGHTLVDTCCAEILPKNDVMSVELPFSSFESSNRLCVYFMHYNISIFTPAPIDETEIKFWGVNLSNEQNAIMRMPNTVCSLKAYLLPYFILILCFLCIVFSIVKYILSHR